MSVSIYINLEDDVSKVVARLQKQKGQEVVLVCPKRCFLFNDSINLRLLKKQTDLMKKTVSILTMDERGQMYAKEAGFDLKFLPHSPKNKFFSDINPVGFKGHEKKAIPYEDTKNLELAPVLTKTIKSSKSVSENYQSQKKITPKISVTDNIFPAEIAQIYKEEKKQKVWGKILLGFTVVCAFMAALLYFVILPKAVITVVPKSENLTRDLEISVASAIKNPDASRLVLPAVKITEEIELNKKFESQGKKEVGSKATGFVRIYNFTKNPLNLKANTTILTIGNKSYLLTKDIILLRPTEYKDAKTKEVDESSLAEPVEIIAAEGGESFNAPAGTRLEITNQVLGSKPQIVFAKTESPIAGGLSRYISVVSENDISNSQNVLKNSAFDLLQDKLKKQNLFLSEGSYKIETAQFTTDKGVGSQSPSFEAYIKVKVTGIAINLTDLNKLVVQRISQTLSNNKTLEENKNLSSDSLAFKMKDLDLNNELGILSVHFQGKVWYIVPNLDDYQKQLANKTPEEANTILLNNDEIERIDILLTPSWQKTLPFIASKINIQVLKD